MRPQDGQKIDMEKIKQAARDIIAKYQALGDEIKQELKTTFPNTAKIISSEFPLFLTKFLFYDDIFTSCRTKYSETYLFQRYFGTLEIANLHYKFLIFYILIKIF